jgi:VanZ family protein
MSLLTIAPWFVIALAVVAATGLIGSFWRPNSARCFSLKGASLPAPPRRGHYLILLAFFAAFALYGSLIPFQFRALEFAEALKTFSQILRSEVVVESRSDWLANVLLAIPLGFCGLAVLGVDRPGMSRQLLQAAFVVPICTTFSAGLEFSQLWAPPRTCSQNDIAAQTIGAIGGAGLWLIAGQPLTNFARGFLSNHETREPTNRLMLAYSAVLVIYSVLPLDLTISPAELYHKFRDGRVMLRPLIWEDFSPQQISNTLANALLFATVGMLAASRRGAFLQERPLLRAVLWAFCLSLGIETVQLFVLSRFTKASDIVLGTLAAVIGGGSSVLLSSRARSLRHHPAADQPRVYPWFILAAVYAVCLVILFAAPFEWLHDPVRIAKRWRNMWKIPFAYAKYWGDPLDALSDVMLKLLLFGSLGALLARGLAAGWTSPSRRRLWHAAAVMVCAALALTIELLQVYLPPHVADVTDVLLAASGAWLGIMAVSYIVQHPIS